MKIILLLPAVFLFLISGCQGDSIIEEKGSLIVQINSKIMRFENGRYSPIKNSPFSYLAFDQDGNVLLITKNNGRAKLKKLDNPDITMITAINSAYTVRGYIFAECHINPSLSLLLRYDTVSGMTDSFFFGRYILLEEGAHIAALVFPPHFGVNKNAMSTILLDNREAGKILLNENDDNEMIWENGGLFINHSGKKLKVKLNK